MGALSECPHCRPNSEMRMADGVAFSLRQSHLLQSNYRDKMIFDAKQREMPSGGVRMKKTILGVALFFLVSVLEAVAQAQLQSFLDNLNIRASDDQSADTT
jgi:hypothetical protein